MGPEVLSVNFRWDVIAYLLYHQSCNVEGLARVEVGTDGQLDDAFGVATWSVLETAERNVVWLHEMLHAKSSDSTNGDEGVS